MFARLKILSKYVELHTRSWNYQSWRRKNPSISYKLALIMLGLVNLSSKIKLSGDFDIFHDDETVSSLSQFPSVLRIERRVKRGLRSLRTQPTPIPNWNKFVCPIGSGISSFQLQASQVYEHLVLCFACRWSLVHSSHSQGGSAPIRDGPRTPPELWQSSRRQRRKIQNKYVKNTYRRWKTSKDKEAGKEVENVGKKQ